MCRDLLFHTQEHQFTWTQIQQCCEQLELEFVGLQVNGDTFRLYRKTYPQDVGCKNLTNWHQLELKHPQMFAGMYSFWCKKK